MSTWTWDPRFTMTVGLLQHGGLHSYMEPWYMVVHPHSKRMGCYVAREVVGGPGGP
jgi:hypothetical protein